MLEADISQRAIALAESEVGQWLDSLLIFGSDTSVSRDEFSDTDVLCLLTEGRVQSKVVIVDSVTFDFHFTDITSVRRALSPASWRDNLPLLALSTGQIILDHNGHMSELRSLALQLWASGTGELSLIDIIKIREGASKLALAAQKLSSRISRAAFDGVEAGTLAAHLEFVHTSSCALYMRVCSRWAFPPWIVDQISEPFYQELAAWSGAIYQEKDPVVRGERIAAITMRTRDLAVVHQRQLENT